MTTEINIVLRLLNFFFNQFFKRNLMHDKTVPTDTNQFKQAFRNQKLGFLIKTKQSNFIKRSMTVIGKVKALASKKIIEYLSAS